MQFYERLYTGERAAGKRFFILRRLRKKQVFPELYVITPASGGNNLLDILSCRELYRPWREAGDPLIVGIALGYDDACLLAGRIVNEVYQATGGFDVKGFLSGGQPPGNL